MGCALMSAIGGIFYTYRGTICHPQDVTAIVLAVSATGIAAAWRGGQEASLLATIVMLVAVATLVAGIVTYLSGIANVAGAMGGGLIGFQLLSGTTLGKKLHLPGILPGLSAAAGCAITFLFGGTLLSLLPVGLFVTVVAYLGIDFLLTWLWVRRKQLSIMDYALRMTTRCCCALMRKASCRLARSRHPPARMHEFAATSLACRLKNVSMLLRDAGI